MSVLAASRFADAPARTPITLHAADAAEFAKALRIAGYRFDLADLSGPALHGGHLRVEDAFGERVTLRLVGQTQAVAP